MISKKMENMVANSSAIRAMFEEGNRLAKIYGAENVFDFSLGNPNVPAPEEVKNAIIELLNEEDPIALHGYTNSNAGYADVREAVAQSLNARFGTEFEGKNIVMTVGAAGGLNVILKSLLNPADEVIVFAPISENTEVMSAIMTVCLSKCHLIQRHFSRNLQSLKKRSRQRRKR